MGKVEASPHCTNDPDTPNARLPSRTLREPVPGVVIIQPDFPELKEGWPFLWYENEYVVDTVTSYILAANAAHAETKSPK